MVPWVFREISVIRGGCLDGQGARPNFRFADYGFGNGFGGMRPDIDTCDEEAYKGYHIEIKQA